MTPAASHNPWITTAASDARPEPIDMSPAAILARDVAIRRGIDGGLVGPSLAMRCRAAVAAGIAAGIVHPPGAGSKV